MIDALKIRCIYHFVTVAIVNQKTVTVGRTTVTIAHRLTSIQNVDCIAVVEKGSIVEQGNHTHLLTKGEGGAYFGLIKLQNRQ